MNVYGWIILTALLVETALQIAAKLLNLKSMVSPLPEEVSDIYDGDAYRKSQAYERTATRFGLVTMMTDLIILLAFLVFARF